MKNITLILSMIALAVLAASLSALAASAATPLILVLVGKTQIALLFLFFTVLLYWRHADNIGRLLRGEEGRIGAKKT